ncbi:hypothetical protein AYP92_03075 [Lactobacillus crispatus]|nr:hypothetical protein AYP77_02245 [Lactobacillus crispatus]OXC40990.1 hypothetical protein AYP92_03075 [Lactobacillus crispatus]
MDLWLFPPGITPASRTSSGTNAAKLMFFPIANQEKLPEKWGQVNICIVSDLSNPRITPASSASSGTKVAILALDPICNQEKLPEKWGQII